MTHMYVSGPHFILPINILRSRQNGRHFPDDIFKCIFLNEIVYISIQILLKFVPKGPISNIPSLTQIMAWRRSGDKPLSEPMMVDLPTHICVTRPQWLNTIKRTMRCKGNIFQWVKSWMHLEIPGFKYIVQNCKNLVKPGVFLLPNPIFLKSISVVMVHEQHSLKFSISIRNCNKQHFC